MTWSYIPNFDRGPYKALATMLTTCDDHHERAQVLGHWHRCPGLSEGHSSNVMESWMMMMMIFFLWQIF